MLKPSLPCLLYSVIDCWVSLLESPLNHQTTCTLILAPTANTTGTCCALSPDKDLTCMVYRSHILLRSLPWWALHGAGLLTFIRIGLSHCCVMGLASWLCGLCLLVLLCLIMSHHSPWPLLMHGVVLVCCLVVWLIDWMCACLCHGHGFSLMEGDSLMCHYVSAYMVLHIPWWTCTILFWTDSCLLLQHHTQ